MSHAVVVMGVTASGKSTLAQALALAMGWPFIEGDSLHPDANIAKMTAGIPLDDEDRVPWLENVAAAIASHEGRCVLSCSALKRSYRDRLRRADAALLFVYPELTRPQLAARLQQRRDHFMPPTLLDSQFAALEPPAADERCIRVDGSEPTAHQVAVILRMIPSCI